MLITSNNLEYKVEKLVERNAYPFG